MTDSNAGHVLGATTTAATGIAILPNTGGNPMLVILGTVSLLAGALLFGSLIATRVARKLQG